MSARLQQYAIVLEEMAQGLLCLGKDILKCMSTPRRHLSDLTLNYEFWLLTTFSKKKKHCANFP